jgi:glycosyltransferase involved in cell wall biosynthesis
VARLLVLLRGEGTAADGLRTLTALRRHTTDLEECPCNPRAVDAAVQAAASSRGVCVIHTDVGSGAVGDALAWDFLESDTEPDVVMLEVGVTVAANWEESLRSAAYQDAVIATASAASDDLLALTNAPDEGMAEVSASARGTALGEPVWGCVYVRRDALNIAKNVRSNGESKDREPPTPPEALILVPGMVHVLADTVATRPAGRLATSRAVLTPSALAALAGMEAALEPIRVLIDMRCCVYPLSGTQVHALNLVSRLGTRADVAVSMLMPLDPDRSSWPYLESLPPTVTRYREGERVDPAPHIFHRPYQVFEGQINDLVTSTARLVITHQDMILDRTPAYFRSREKWQTYAAATALSFVAADEVVFYSEHAREEAVRDGLVDRSKTSVVPPGTDHLDDASEGVKPSLASDLMPSDGRTFLLFVGNNYLHKNRLFALRLAEELKQHHGWNGLLVFVGGRTTAGASMRDESAFRREHAGVETSLLDLGRVTDAELRWLYQHAALVLFPSLYEGFGLIPFEAAAAGAPSAYSSRSSVGEYLPAEGALLDLSDVPATALRVQRVLEDGDLANRIVRAIRSAGQLLTWSRTADSYVDIYKRAITRPVGLSLVLGSEVTVGARSEIASTEAERRMLQVFKKSAGVRRAADTLLKVALTLRRATRP